MEKFKLLIVCLLIFNTSVFAQEFKTDKEETETENNLSDSEKIIVNLKCQISDKSPRINAEQASFSQDIDNRTMSVLTPEGSSLVSSSINIKPSISSKKNAISVNGGSAFLPRKYIYAEYERLLTSKLSIGIHAGYQSYHTDDYDGTDGGEWGGHKGFGVGTVLRYYPQGLDELKGFYIGGGFDILFSEWWWRTRYHDPSEPAGGYTIYEDGNSVAIAGAAQIGYKWTIGDFFYIEPSVIGGFFGSISSDSDVESGPILMPGLALGVRL